MSAENEALARRFFEEFCNGRDAAVADEIIADDYVSHGPQAPPAEGPDGVKARVAVYQDALDGHWDVQEIHSMGDRVVVRWIGTGTHNAELMGVPATGENIAVEAITIMRIADGQIAEEWTVWDALGLLQQVGAVPVAGLTPPAGRTGWRAAERDPPPGELVPPSVRATDVRPQPVAERIQRVVMRVTDVDRLLRQGPRP